MIEVQAPNPIPWNDNHNTWPKIFLAGSIEMGKAENWQQKVIDSLKDYEVIILNPRRNDWDSSEEQVIENPYFATQVNWELDFIEHANLVIFYFDPNTLSPITLLELGLIAKLTSAVWVVCPEGYWRKGNVDIVCQRYDLHQFETLEDLIEAAKGALFPVDN